MVECYNAADADSELIGPISSPTDTYNSLYQIDIVQQKAEKLLTISEDYLIANSDINEKWIVWVEKNDNGRYLNITEKPTQKLIWKAVYVPKIPDRISQRSTSMKII